MRLVLGLGASGRNSRLDRFERPFGGRTLRRDRSSDTRSRPPSAAWTSYLGNLSSTAPGAGNATSWDAYEEEILGYPAPDPNVQWRMVGSGPYDALVDPSGNPPGYTLHANPDYTQPAGCSGAGGVAAYPGGCYPIPARRHPERPGTLRVVRFGRDQSAYRAGGADFATILPPETEQMLELAQEGKLNYYVAPDTGLFFFPINLNWSAAVYASDAFPGTPNIPHAFFSGEAARALMTESYPFNQAEATDWTFMGSRTSPGTGGPIPRADGVFYPSNVSLPDGKPRTDPSTVGGAAWWWAQGTNPLFPYLRPVARSVPDDGPCEFPIVGTPGNPGLDASISEWISRIESISSDLSCPSLTTSPSAVR